MHPLEVLDPRELDPHVEEMRGANALIDKLLPQGLDVSTPERVAALRGAEGGLGALRREGAASASDRFVAGPAGEIRIRVTLPDAPKGVYLHVHGGGWCLGRPEMSDADNAELAAENGLAVVSVDYRLAPEQPYPAGPDDCEAVALWLLARAEAEFGTARLFIGGESSGAHLAALTLLRLRDRHGEAGRFLGANLVFGIYDAGFTPSHRLAGDSLPFVSLAAGEHFNAYFLPGQGREARRAPEVSPLYADLAGLPPALFSVGSRDPLLDDSLFMASRWQAAGNRTALAVYPEAPHGFTMLPVEMARIARARCRKFLAER